MPSPIGHAIAGAAVAWSGDAIDGRPSSARLVATCAVLGAVADIDLLLPRYHRSITHSFVAVGCVLIIAACVTGEVSVRHQSGVRHRWTRWRVAVLCAAAYASHLLLDWLGADTLAPAGIQVFWPFVQRFFVSGLDLFAETERRHPLSGPTMRQNLWAVAQEVAILAPVAAALFAVRVKALARFSAQVARRDHAAQ